MRMRAQHVFKPSKQSRPASMTMPVSMGATQATGARLAIAHDSQDGPAIRLQHIDNNHPKAVANDPQFPPCRGSHQ
jgi:hypothetical protein